VRLWLLGEQAHVDVVDVRREWLHIILCNQADDLAEQNGQAHEAHERQRDSELEDPHADCSSSGPAVSAKAIRNKTAAQPMPKKAWTRLGWDGRLVPLGV
jgi:hypothetical protein